jgi:hypothetical protein
VTVYVGIVSALVLLLAVLALFLFRSLSGREPSQVAVVQGNAKWLGAELTLSGPALPVPYKAYITHSDRYSVPFFVPPGRYELSVRVGDAEVYRSPFELVARRNELVALPLEIPTTLPTTRGVQ